ncbi:MAG: nucleotide kinase [Lachnospiraceae bacterium]|nr:nucleotide kinase [Lachnospiraceae bacterium]
MNTDLQKTHLFLTGEKQVGKSTLIKKLLSDNTRDLCGFFTVRICSTSDGLWYTHLIRPGEAPSADNILFCCSDKSADSSERFDILGCRALEESGDLILMDELGPHEEKAYNFKKRVLDLLNGSTPILGVLQKADSEFLNSIACHSNVRVVEVTRGNRDSLYDKLMYYIEKL